MSRKIINFSKANDEAFAFGLPNCLALEKSKTVLKKLILECCRGRGGVHCRVGNREVLLCQRQQGTQVILCALVVKTISKTDTADMAGASETELREVGEKTHLILC